MKILSCEGYKMFYGEAKIVPKNPNVAPFYLTGTWLFRPDTDCWYCNGSSFSKEIVDLEGVE